MHAQRLSLALQKIGRDRGWAYVSDSFRPHLRRDPKWRQWNRLSRRAALLAMDPQLRGLLNGAAAIRIAASTASSSGVPLEETPLGRSLLANGDG